MHICLGVQWESRNKTHISNGPARRAGPKYLCIKNKAKELTTNWLWTYKNDKPSMAIGGITSAIKLKISA
jgi:hypothetical protein